MFVGALQKTIRENKSMAKEQHCPTRTSTYRRYASAFTSQKIKITKAVQRNPLASFLFKVKSVR